MNKTKRFLALALALVMVFAMLPVSTASAASGSKWVSAWSTSPIDASLSELGILDELAVPVGAISNRMVIESTASGTQVRFVLSNEYSLVPMTVKACSVGRVVKSSLTDCVMNTLTARTVRVNGRSTFTIPAGGAVTTDPVIMKVTAGEKLCVNIYYKDVTAIRTIGLIGADSYIGIGNTTHSNKVVPIPLKYEADSGSYEITTTLKEMDVKAAAGTETCVVFGDSTVASEIPRLLAAKLRANGISNISVTQEAIKGNRLVANGVGKAAKLLGRAGVDRFAEDVLGQAGVTKVIVKLGINDVVHPHCASKAGKAPYASLDDMIAGYQKLIAMAHAQGVEIYFCEVTPWKGYTRNVFGAGDDVQWTAEIDQLRVDINAWLSSEACPSDGFISLSGMSDPADPTQLIPSQTPDGIHHNAAGQANFVSLIDVNLIK